MSHKGGTIMEKKTIIAIAVVAALALGVLVGVGAMDSSTSQNNTTNNISETDTAGSLSVKVTQVEDRQQVGSSILGAQTENNFMLVYVTIKNNTNGEVTLLSSNFCLYKGSAKYEVSYAGIYVSGGFLLIETIGAGLTSNMVVVFETPTKHTEDKYTFEIKSRSNSLKIPLDASESNIGSNSPVYINETATAGNLSVKVTKVEDKKQLGSSYFSAQTNDNFILVHVTIKNNGNSEVKFTSNNFHLYKDSARYEVSSNGFYVSGGFWASESVGPGITLNTIVVFETPSKHTVDDYKFEVNQSSGMATILLK